MNKVKNILLWVFSIFMFLCGAVIIGEAVISALLMFAIGIISNPLFLKRVHTKRIINIIACVVLFLVAAISFPGGDTNTKPVTTQSTEEITEEKTTEEESTKSKKELEESKKESSIAASKKAAKESSIAASKKAAKESSITASKAEESRKAAEESSITASKKAAEESSIAEASIQASIAESSAQASAAQVSIEQSQQASIAQSSIEQSQQASAAQVQGPMVWITATGEKYHNKPNCGNSNPATSRQISLQEAQSRGYQPCQKCY